MKNAFALLLLLIPVFAQAQDIRTLMPRPKNSFFREGEFVLSRSTNIVIADVAGAGAP